MGAVNGVPLTIYLGLFGWCSALEHVLYIFSTFKDIMSNMNYPKTQLVQVTWRDSDGFWRDRDASTESWSPVSLCGHLVKRLPLLLCSAESGFSSNPSLTWRAEIVHLPTLQGTSGMENSNQRTFWWFSTSLASGLAEWCIYLALKAACWVKLAAALGCSDLHNQLECWLQPRHVSSAPRHSCWLWQASAGPPDQGLFLW